MNDVTTIKDIEIIDEHNYCMSLAGALSNALSLAVANGNELLDEDVATICLELTVRIGRAKELFKEYHGRHIPDTKNKEKKNDK